MYYLTNKEAQAVYYTVIKYQRNVETRAAGEIFLHFPSALKCPECFISVIHGLGFFIRFMIETLPAQNNKTRFLSVSYSDKT